MNILITGGTGLIGKALSKKLVKLGHAVTIVTRDPEKNAAYDQLVKFIGWELQTLITAVDSVDAVINLAGTSIAGDNPLRLRWTKKKKNNIKFSRIESGNLITTAISQAKNKPEVMIQASAIGYYGNSGEGLVDETSGPGEDFLSGVCQLWEGTTKTVEELGVRRAITRIGLVFSNQGGILKLLKLPFDLYLGGKIGSGKQYLSWIHINDLVDGMIFILNNPKTQGIYNLTAPNPAQNQEFSQALADVVKKPAWLPVPGFILNLALGEAATLALDGRAVFPRRLLDAGYSFQYEQLTKALSDLLS